MSCTPWTTLTAALLFTAAVQGQGKCPPLPEGSTCDHYHYHMSIWDPDGREFHEITATRQFASISACEKAKMEALRENAAFVEFMKTANVDGSMLPNRFGDCHCDRTDDSSTASYVDAKQRVAQVREQQDVAWTLRERLLGHSAAGAADRLNAAFSHPPPADRFTRETIPSRAPAPVSPRPPRTLIDSTIGAHNATPVVAAALSLVAVPPPPAAPGAGPPVAPPAPGANTQQTPSPAAPPAEEPPRKP